MIDFQRHFVKRQCASGSPALILMSGSRQSIILIAAFGNLPIKSVHLHRFDGQLTSGCA